MMTVYDDLREEMKKRGMSDQQCNSKAVAVALDIITQSGDKYSKMLKEETEVSDRLYALRWSLKDAERMIELAKTKTKELERSRQQSVQDIKDAEAAIFECETAEGRDTMRAARFFFRNVETKSDWDNKYLISGLAAILSRGNIYADLPKRKEDNE